MSLKATGSLNSDHVNYLIWRYLQERGFGHTAVQLMRDWKCKQPQKLPFANSIQPHDLVSLLHDGLTYDELSSNTELRSKRYSFTEERKWRVSASVPSSKHTDELGDDGVNAKGAHPRKRQKIDHPRKSPEKDRAPSKSEDAMEVDQLTPSQEPKEQVVIPEPEPEPPTTLAIGTSTGIQVETPYEPAIAKTLANIDLPAECDIINLNWRGREEALLMASGGSIWRCWKFDETSGELKDLGGVGISIEEGMPSEMGVNSKVTKLFDGSTFCISATSISPDCTKFAAAYSNENDVGTNVSIVNDIEGKGNLHLEHLLTLPAPVISLRWSQSLRYLLSTYQTPSNAGLKIFDAETSVESDSVTSEQTAEDATWSGESHFVVCGQDTLKLYELIKPETTSAEGGASQEEEKQNANEQKESILDEEQVKEPQSPRKENAEHKTSEPEEPSKEERPLIAKPLTRLIKSVSSTSTLWAFVRSDPTSSDIACVAPNESKLVIRDASSKDFDIVAETKVEGQITGIEWQPSRYPASLATPSASEGERLEEERGNNDEKEHGAKTHDEDTEMKDAHNLSDAIPRETKETKSSPVPPQSSLSNSSTITSSNILATSLNTGQVLLWRIMPSTSSSNTESTQNDSSTFQDEQSNSNPEQIEPSASLSKYHLHRIATLQMRSSYPHRFTPDPTPPVPITIITMAFSPDGHYIAAAGEDRICIWPMDSFSTSHSERSSTESHKQHTEEETLTERGDKPLLVWKAPPRSSQADDATDETKANPTEEDEDTKMSGTNDHDDTGEKQAKEEQEPIGWPLEDGGPFHCLAWDQSGRKLGYSTGNRIAVLEVPTYEIEEKESDETKGNSGEVIKDITDGGNEPAVEEIVNHNKEPQVQNQNHIKEKEQEQEKKKDEESNGIQEKYPTDPSGKINENQNEKTEDEEEQKMDISEIKDDI